MHVVGHRGAGSLEPENTLRSFRRAEREGVDEFELDLRLTRDGKLVVLHDATVDRTTTGAGNVCELTWSEVRALDAGAGERIPLFEEVLAATTLPLQTELKAPAALDPLIRLVRTRKLKDRLYITSQSIDLLRAVRAAAPELTVGLIISHPDENALEQCRAAGAAVVCPRVFELTVPMVDSLAAQHVRILPWPVNTPEAYEAVTSLGVDGFATDRPDLAAAWEGRRRASRTDQQISTP